MVTLARRIYYLAIDAGILKNNPFARRGVFAEHPTGKYIPADEFEKIYKHLPEYIQPVVLTAYLSGMRQGEIIHLTMDDEQADNAMDRFNSHMTQNGGNL